MISYELMSLICRCFMIAKPSSIIFFSVIILKVVLTSPGL